MAKHDIYIK